MKQTIFFITFLMSSLICFSQDKTETKEDFIIPKNKTALNDLVEETKQKIIEADKKVKGLQSYSQSLSNYKAKISSVESTKLETIYSNIANNITLKNTDDIYLQEETLISFIQSLSFSFAFRFQTTDNFNDNTTASDFFAKIGEFLKPIQTSDILRLMSNNHDNDNNKPFLTDNDKLQKIKLQINPLTITEIKNKLLPLIENEISQSKKNIELAQSELQKLKSNRSKVLEKLNEEETEINGLSIKLGLPLFCLTILLLFLGPNFINRTSTQPKTESNSQNVLLEISTVLLLTMSILILGLSGKINSDVLGTLIGGISGYVLNRIRTRNDIPSETTK